MNKRRLKLFMLAVMLAAVFTAGCGARHKSYEKEDKITVENQKNIADKDTAEGDESSEKTNEEKIISDDKTITAENMTSTGDNQTTIKETKEDATTLPQPATMAETEPVTKQTESATSALPQNLLGSYDVVYYSRRNFNDAVYAKAKSVVNSIITSEMNEVQKVRVIHDYIVINTSYAEEMANNIYGCTGAEPEFSAYGALINKSAVCEGYAEAFLLLCWNAGIDARLVLGTASDENGNSGGHEWNVVQINGKWYHVDCTWDDPIIYSGGGQLSDDSNLSYNYFLITDDDMRKDHFIEEYYNDIGIVCNSKDYYEYSMECSLQKRLGNTPYKKVTGYDEAKQAMNGFFAQGYTTFAMVYAENSLNANTLMDNALKDYMAYSRKPGSYGVNCNIGSDRGLTITTITLRVN